MKSNTGTIFRKELSRFFGDRALVFTTIIMPGLLIYLIYSLMGDGMMEQFMPDPDKQVTMYVDNMPQCMENEFATLPMLRVDGPADTATLFAQLRDKDDSPIYVSFPKDFDSLMSANTALGGHLSATATTPNVTVYYNSACAESGAASDMVQALLNQWESSRINLFDINAPSDTNPMAVYDMASQEDVLGSVLSQLIPMLLLMLMVSGCMAVAPSAIAGEKERGTIATLLVTPLKRSELALGKILSLSLIALLSGLSSFLGVMLSLPKMLSMGNDTPNLTISYGATDYVSLLLIILSTVLVTISVMSILSAMAKDVKNAGTMLTPFMLLVMVAGMSPMFTGDIATAWTPYLIPFYNSAQCMASIFARDTTMVPVIVTVASNIIYMVIALVVLTKMFNSEKVMFSR